MALTAQSHAQSSGALSDGAQAGAAPGARQGGVTATQLYAHAQDDIRRGRFNAAARNLAELIERYPYGALAKRARATLRVLYAKQKRARRPRAADGSAVPSPRRASPRRTGPRRTGPRRAGPGKANSGKLRKLRITVSRAKPKLDYLDDFKLAVADRVFFGQDSIGLGSRARAVVSAQAKWLKARPHLTIILNAHADENGTKAFNKSLSRQRGEAVRDLLLARGVPSRRIKIAAHGRTKPVVRCKSTGCAAQNRRVVADVVPGGALSSTIATVSAPAAVPAPVPAPVPVPVPARRNRN